MSPLRVLLLSHEYPKPDDMLSGVAAHRLVLALQETRCEVQVVSPVPLVPAGARTTAARRALARVPRSYVVDGIRVLSPRYLRLPGAWYRPAAGLAMAMGAGKDVARVVRGFRPQLIHSYAATPDGQAAAVLGRKHRLPAVCTLIGSDINDYPNEGRVIRSVTRHVLRTTTQTVAVSKALASAAVQLSGRDISPMVVYMGCDVEAFRFDDMARDTCRSRLGISGDQQLVVSLGYMHRAKGSFDLLEACCNLSLHGRPVHLAFVGWGEARAELEQEARNRGVGALVHFVILPAHEEIPGWLSAADIFALPSHSEGLPLAVLEAMSCSRAVVATRVGGIPEAVDEGKSGLLVPPGDVNALTQALALLAENPDRARAMGAAGRASLEENFTWTRSATSMLSVYEHMFDRARVSPSTEGKR